MYSVQFNIWVHGISYVGLHLLFLLVAGLSGTILSYLGFKAIRERYSVGWLADLGTYTFSIYMVQGVLFNAFLAAFPVNLKYQTLYFLVSVAITWLIWKFVTAISLSKKLSPALIGKSKN